MIVYHIGQPRIMFLGALKLTTIFVFGFFAVIIVPGYASADVPLWKPIAREFPALQYHPSDLPAHAARPPA
jgi:hypothetical protein